MKRAKAMSPAASGPRLWTAEAVRAHTREVVGLPPDAELTPPARAPEPAASLTEQLFARDAQALEDQRHAPVRAYLAVLDNRVAALLGRPVGILAALQEERRNVVACAAKIRPAL